MTPKIMSIEQLHVKSEGKLKAIRFARVIVDDKGKTTYEVKVNDKWTGVKEQDFPLRVTTLRSQLIEKLKPKTPGKEA